MCVCACMISIYIYTHLYIYIYIYTSVVVLVCIRTFLPLKVYALCPSHVYHMHRDIHKDLHILHIHDIVSDVGTKGFQAMLWNGRVLSG